MNVENDSKWLFKYMPFNFNAVKLLTNNEQWFGKPDTQNDPNEAEFILNAPERIVGFLELRIGIQEELEYLISYERWQRKILYPQKQNSSLYRIFYSLGEYRRRNKFL
jgi:hypothetical protein